MTPDVGLVARLVERVGTHLLAPPKSTDPVLTFGDPDEIMASREVQEIYLGIEV